jgi:4-hydroxyphenylacetate 3-monooxygenase/anthranilate 3-monooxygenase (FAD)/4-hydroxyphenylacetate 3-monooxygenase
MSARTGQQYLEGLRDDRVVWLGNEKIDVLRHPAFAGSLRGMAGYFDWQHQHAGDCLVNDPEAGTPMSASLVVPHTRADLARRHVCFDRLARYSAGMLGRTPDYVNVTLAGFVARSDVFTTNGETGGAENLRRFHREVVERDLSLTHTIVHPVVDKTLPDTEGINGELATRVVRRTSSGIVVRGAKILATLGPFADELFVYPGHPLAPNADPAYALSFSIPMATKGLVTLCRDHYGSPGLAADHPFSSRFDEQDAFMIFDDVEIPYERVFIDGNLDVYNSLLMHGGWAANILQQTGIRAAVKLEFAYELCTRMAQATNADGRPDTAQMLGEIWAYATLTRAAVRAAEDGGHDHGNGAFFCDDRPLRAIRDVMPGWMARTNEILKLVGAHNLLATPSLSAFDDPELAPLVERYLPGANGMQAIDRAKLFRTAWDFVGSALGGRGELYERFYLASAARNFALDHRIAQMEREWNEVPAFLDALSTQVSEDADRRRMAR